jgi:16S rRNA processing protein RimM
LLKESERKNRELALMEQHQQRQKRSRPQPEIKPLPKLEFPDTQTIDPYDPQTFGYVELGSVLGAHGVQGWLKVRTNCKTTISGQSRLCSPGVRHIKPANKRAPRRVILLQGRHRQADEYLVQLDDVHDRDAAQKLRGATLYIREEQQREDDLENTDKTAADDQEEYFVQDLVGLEVFLTGGHFVGTVRGVVFADEFCSVPGLGHDYLELLLPRGVGGTASWKDELVLVPLVPQIVPHVDIAKGEIYLDPPAGLLDLTYIRQQKSRIKGFLSSSSDQS